MANLSLLARQGLLTRETLVWGKDWQTSVPAGTVPELASLFSAAPASVAAPIAPREPQASPPGRSAGILPAPARQAGSLRYGAGETPAAPAPREPQASPPGRNAGILPAPARQAGSLRYGAGETPAAPVRRAPVHAPAAGSKAQRKYVVLALVAAAVLLLVLVAFAGLGLLAWKFLAQPAPPAQTEPPTASPTVGLPPLGGASRDQSVAPRDKSVPPRDKGVPPTGGASEARVVLDNQRLLLEAWRFRGLASGKLDDALKAYGSPASLEFLRASTVGREAPQAWAYFFSCSLLLIGHAQHPRPVIAFYHPFLDAALLTRWSWNGDEATISDATLWIGGCFPDGQAAPPEYPHWMGAARSTPFHEALLAGQREFVGRFDREFPIQPVDPSKFPQSASRGAVQDFVEQQAAAQLLTLIKLRTHRGLANLRQALAEGRASALDALIPPGSSLKSATLLKLPRELRQRLLPSFALCSSEHTIVVLSLPELPRFYILAQFGKAEAPLEHLSVQELN
jgi:hypothetical protein